MYCGRDMQGKGFGWREMDICRGYGRHGSKGFSKAHLVLEKGVRYMDAL